MIRQIRTLLDRGWIMGVAAVVLVVAAVGVTSVVASAADPLARADPVLGTQLREAIPAFETPYGLQSWPHGTCVDSREVEAYSLGCNGGAFQRYRMHLVPQGNYAFQLVNVATADVAPPGWCLDSKPGGEVVTSRCSDSSLTQAWTLDVGHRDSDGRAVMHYLNRGTGLWLALGRPSGRLDVYATGDAATFDRDFAINW